MENLNEVRREIDAVDEEIAKLFCRRMRAVERVAAYKRERGLPILDEAREEAVLRRNCDRVEDDELRGYYFNFQRDVMRISRAYQQKLLHGMRQNDDANALVDKMLSADVIVLATPVYFYSMDAQLKTLIDRSVSRWNDFGRFKGTEFWHITHRELHRCTDPQTHLRPSCRKKWPRNRSNWHR